MPRRAVELTKCFFITGELTRDITAAIYEYTGDNGAYANYGIYVGTMTSYRHVSLLFPLLPIILGFEKIPYYSKTEIPA
jgi:hypothetical protein